MYVVMYLVQDPFKPKARRSHRTSHQTLSTVPQDTFKAPPHFGLAAKSRWKALHGKVDACVERSWSDRGGMTEVTAKGHSRPHAM